MGYFEREADDKARATRSRKEMMAMIKNDE